jgi:hypothetical protein
MENTIIENNKRPFDWNVAGKRLGIILLGLFVLVLVFFGIFCMFFLNFVDRHEIGYKYDRRTGQITILERTGYFITPPFVVNISAIDTRPEQVCINANSRVLNCKLVKFNPKGLELFIKWHGRNASNVSEILKSYAYDGRKRTYPFLDIITELGAQENSSPENNEDKIKDEEIINEVKK